MRSVTVRLDDLRTMILNLGFVGENEHRKFNFDCKKMFGEYPSASVSLTVQPPAGDCYPATVERNGDLVSWTVTDSDLIEEGCGEIQLTFMVGEVVAKTCIGRTRVERSLGATGDIPTPIENWIEQAEEVISEAEAATAAAEDAAEHQPIIDDNGYWAVWDADAEEYVATEYKAQGTDGHDGVGIVSIEKTGTSGLVDTYTITFTSGNPVTYTVTNGRDADPAELIDDTAGAGDTDKVWSADKSHELLTEINSKADEPTGTKTAGKVYGLDNNLNPAWVDVAIDPEDIAEAVDDWLDEHPEATTTVEDGSVTQKKLSFAELVLPGNLFDYTSENMCVTGSYYNESAVGNTVSLKTNQYTTGYAALKIPIYNVEKVTVDIYPNSSGSGKKVYWIGAVDSSMKLLSYNTANQQGPVTFTIPSGTEYVLISYSIGANDFNAILPKVMVASGESITGYYSYFTPYYILNGCKVDVTDTQKIQSIVGAGENTVKFKMPDVYDAIVNEPIQIFFKGIVDAVNYGMYYVQVLCDSGNVFDRYFELTPTQAGNITATFNLYGINHNVLDTKTVTFAVHERPTNPASQKNVLCVGDSLTQAGEWVTEFSRRLTGSGGSPSGDGLTNINFIGTRQKNGVNYEGYGGWTFNSYNTEHTGTNAKIITCSHDKTASDQHSIYKDSANYQWKLETIETGNIKILAVTGEGTSFPSTGTLTWVSGGVNHSDIVYTASENAPGNPFWINGEVDFGAYATEQGVSSIDYVLVLLGWNNTAATESEYKTAAQTFITNVHTDFPNAKIILMGLEIPARNGLGINYKATYRHSYYNLMQYVFNLDQWYKDLLSDNSNTYSANLSGQFDTEYNMQTTQKAVNSRNATTITFQSNGLHPANPGYLQIADAFYRKFVSIM